MYGQSSLTAEYVVVLHINRVIYEYEVADPVRGLLDRKRSEEHLQTSNESIKTKQNKNKTKNDKKKGITTQSTCQKK